MIHSFHAEKTVAVLGWMRLTTAGKNRPVNPNCGPLTRSGLDCERAAGEIRPFLHAGKSKLSGGVTPKDGIQVHSSAIIRYDQLNPILITR